MSSKSHHNSAVLPQCCWNVSAVFDVLCCDALAVLISFTTPLPFVICDLCCSEVFMKMNQILRNFVFNYLIDEHSPADGNMIRKYFLEKMRLKRKRAILVLKHVKKGRRRIPKINNYFKLIEKYPDDVFRQHFMMERSTFWVWYFPINLISTLIFKLFLEIARKARTTLEKFQLRPNKLST